MGTSGEGVSEEGVWGCRRAVYYCQCKPKNGKCRPVNEATHPVCM